jgi:putative N6-adenine-specific DNA methylase
MADFFVTTGKGLEELVFDELLSMGITGAVLEKGGVRFSGELAEGYRSCLWLRTASRVLLQLKEFPCQSPAELYDGVHSIDWQRYLTADHTLAVDCTLRDSAMTHSGFVALKTKDAIVDNLRDLLGRRPDVNTRTPDVRINLHLVKNHCTVSLDMSGDPLDRRGYRLERNVAPLRETLAAALVQWSGWSGETSFCDPMCGSGTIVIEAALKAANVAPGLLRETFGFQRWPGYDDVAWKQLIDEARQLRRTTLPVPLYGSDRDPAALKVAQQNALRAGVAQLINFSAGDVSIFTPPAGPGTIICNPPYGERLGDVEALQGLYRQIGDTLKQRCKGYTAYLLCGNLELAKRVGLKATRRIVLWNGPLECRLLKYDLY